MAATGVGSGSGDGGGDGEGDGEGSTWGVGVGSTDWVCVAAGLTAGEACAVGGTAPQAMTNRPANRRIRLSFTPTLTT